MKAAVKMVFCVVALAVGSTGSAQEHYPQKPITVIVPASPGGATDVVARAINSQLSAVLGKMVVVDNKPGASGTIGTSIAARAAPDGYTILMSPPPGIVVEPHYRKLDYDPLRDFAPVTLILTSPHILVVHPSVPVTSVGGLIALGNAKPNALNFASSGLGAPSGLAGEVFNRLTGTHSMHVPFKGAGPATAALIGGQVEFMFAPMPVGLPYVRGQRLRALAVTSRDRSAAVPDVPTLIEAGVNEDVVSFYGVLAPARTPQSVIDTLQRGISKVLKMPRVAEYFASGGGKLVGDTPAQFSSFLHEQYESFGKIVKDLGLRP